MNFIGPQAFTGGPPMQTGGPPGGMPGGVPGGLNQGPLPQGGPQLGPFTPPAARPGMPPTVSAQVPEGARFSPGSVVSGLVARGEGGNFLLQLGDQVLTARSNVPLEPGQSVQFLVQGQDQGQLLLQLVQTPFQQLDLSDLANNLTNLKLPVNEATMQLAQSMVELGIPLTKENMQSLMTASSIPMDPGKAMPPLPERVAAVSFLQANNIPVTPQNVATMAHFLTSNPQIGQQMFALSGELRKLARSTDSSALELLKDIPGAMGEMMLDGGPGRANAQPQPPSRKLFNMAKQTGIETNFTPYGGGDDPWELLAEMRKLLAEHGDSKELEKLMALMQGVQDNLEAQKLINQAHPENWMGYYYLQVPMQLGDGDSAEIWIRYHHEDDGSRTVDPDDTRIEFLVSTEHMGELTFILELKNGNVNVELGTPSEEVRAFAARYLPALGERLAEMNWLPGRMEAVYRPHAGKRQLVERTAFDKLEKCNVQA